MEINRTTTNNFPIHAVFQSQVDRNALGSSEALNTGNQFRVSNETFNGKDVALQNAIFINNTLRNIEFSNSSSTDSLLVNQTAASLTASAQFQNISPIQQNELFLNETLQNLNFVANQPQETLLINETPVALDAEDIFQSLNFVEQNSLLINQNLNNLNAQQSSDEILNDAGHQPAVPQSPTNVSQEVQRTSTRQLATNLELTPLAGGTPLTPEDSLIAGNIVVGQPISPSEINTTELDPQPTENLPETRGGNPDSQPYLLHPYRTSYVIAAYEVRDPGTVPGDPAPVKREVKPIAPVEMVRHIDQLVVSRGQQRESTKKSREHIQTSPPTPIKAIKYMLARANDDLASRGSPLHLVFAKNETKFMLDVYNCSSPELCTLEHDVSLELSNLSTILDNLAEETGLIIDSVL